MPNGKPKIQVVTPVSTPPAEGPIHGPDDGIGFSD